MNRRRARTALFCTSGVLVAGAVWAGHPHFTRTDAFQSVVTLEGVRDHQRALQLVADENGGTRASGTPGYDRSVDYVAQQLTAAGYQAVRQPFEFDFYQEVSPPLLEQLAPAATTYPPNDPAGVFAMEFSPAADVTGRVQGVDLTLPPGAANSSTSGCEPEDFGGFLPGNIALLQRGTCSFIVKAANAEAAGASAVVFFNEGQPGRTVAIPGNLGEPSLNIPVVSIDFALGAELAAAAAADLHIVVDAVTEPRDTENLIADSRCGDPRHTIVVGAHLDSELVGPGINDNGSGSAVILEIAERLARLPCRHVRSRVRFAFWGAEEVGVAGSEHYLSALSAEELARLALNLNFDMLGSPNFVRFVYDGDGSAGGPVGPPGSEQIEQLFLEHFAGLGLPTAPTPLDGRSDYGPFIRRGIPAGGLFSGAEGLKTEEQAALFGGTAGVPYDPCYHEACDDIANVSEVGLDELADAAAHAVLSLASKAQPLDPPPPASGEDLDTIAP